jgi:hypothetical protein
MPTCKLCGHEVPAGAKMCQLCGQEVSDEPDLKDPSTGPLYEVHTRQWFHTGWETFKRYPLGFIWFGVFCLLVGAGLRYLAREIPFGRFFLDALLAPLYVGIFWVCARLQQRRSFQFSDFFYAWQFYQPLLVFGLFCTVISRIGYLLPESLMLRLLCYLAFLAFMMFNIFTPMLIIDRGLGWQEAMGLSYRTVQRRWGAIVGFLLWGFVIAATGFLALLIGSIITVPIWFGAVTAAYTEIFGLQAQVFRTPEARW